MTRSRVAYHDIQLRPPNLNDADFFPDIQLFFYFIFVSFGFLCMYMYADQRKRGGFTMEIKFLCDPRCTGA